MFRANSVGRETVVNRTSPKSENKNIAIVGVNRIAYRYMKDIDGLAGTGATVIGCIKSGSKDDAIDENKLPRILGDMDNFEAIIRKYRIGKVILALDPSDQQSITAAIAMCRRVMVPFEAFTGVSPVVGNGTVEAPDDPAADADEMPDTPLEVPRELWFQRLFDLITSTFLFLLLLPSLIVIAILIKIESRGPLLYSQERMGLDGELFRIFKFRSMYTDAEKHGRPQLAKRNDPRITRIGLIIRRTRLDEIPQLFNIIRGDMSLIGPRPERPYFVEKYSADFPLYTQRLRVKPGLTGYAQVTSGYEASIDDVKTKLEHDLYYIQNRNSVKLFGEILFKTIWVVLSAKGQ